MEPVSVGQLRAADAVRDDVVPRTAVDLGPDGLEFDVLVESTLTWADEALRADFDEDALRITVLADEVTPLGSTVDTEADEVHPEGLPPASGRHIPSGPRVALDAGPC